MNLLDWIKSLFISKPEIEEQIMAKKLYLTEEDYVRAANAIGCEVAAIKAVAKVESRGSGFDDEGNILVLFERHHFRRLTGNRFNSYPDISSYRSGGYTRDEHRRVNKAAKLDKEAAYKSTSWGMFQIMGFNHRVCGYENVLDFVEAMKSGVDKQLDAFTQFILANNLGSALRTKNWKKFARGYNGKLYYKNSYDTKMAAAYKEFSKIKDIAVPLEGDLSIIEVQSALKKLGYAIKWTDGINGPNTKGEVKKFQMNEGLPPTGEVDKVTTDRLQVRLGGD